MKDKSDDCNFSSVRISIGDIRKLLKQGWNVDACNLLIDKLEEIDDRLNKIEENNTFIDKMTAGEYMEINSRK